MFLHLFWESEFKQRMAWLLIGSIATGFAFGWIAGIAACFISLAIMPNVHN